MRDRDAPLRSGLDYLGSNRSESLVEKLARTAKTARRQRIPLLPPPRLSRIHQRRGGGRGEDGKGSNRPNRHDGITAWINFGCQGSIAGQ